MSETVVVTPGTDEGGEEGTEAAAEAVEAAAEAVEAAAEAVEAVAEAAEEVAEGAGGEGDTELDHERRITQLEERVGTHDHFDYVTHGQLGDLVEGRLNAAVEEVTDAVVEAAEVVDESPDVTIVEPDVSENTTKRGGFWWRAW